MDLKKYEILLRAVELGSLSAVANELGYTVAGVSNVVDSIENELGFEVLKRGHNGVSLTESGESIIKDIEEVVKYGNLLKQKASNITGLLTGTITIGSYYSAATLWLPHIIKKFNDKYPHVTIKIKEGGHHILGKWMANNVVDFCITSFDDDANYKWIPIYDDPMVITVNENHPFANKKYVTLQECQKENFVIAANGHDYDVDKLLKETQTKLDIKYTTVENFSAIAMVEKGIAISIMNEMITKSITNKAVNIPLYPPYSINIGIAVPSLRSASPATRKFIDCIKQMASCGELWQK